MPGPDVLSQQLVIAGGVLLRPIADGCIAVVGDNRPEYLDQLRERILAVCVRPTERVELVGLLSELDLTPISDTEEAIDDLLDRGLVGTL